jgi:hypothetical protein
MLCVPSSGHLSSKAGTISCYLLSLMPEVAKSKIAAEIFRRLDIVIKACYCKTTLVAVPKLQFLEQSHVASI